MRNPHVHLAIALTLATLAVPATAQVTPSPSTLLTDAAPGRQIGSGPRDFTTLGAWTYFVASGVQGTELYRTAGDARNTSLFLDIRPGGDSSNPSDLRVAGAYLFFTATDADGVGMFSTDGTAAGTRRFDGAFFAQAGDVVLFRPNGVTGLVLAADPSTGQSTTVLDLTSRAGGLTAIAESREGSNPRVYAAFAVQTSFEEIWELDGTPGGTRMAARRTLPGVSVTLPPLGGAILPSGRLVYVTLETAPSLGYALRGFDPSAGTNDVLALVPLPQRFSPASVFGAEAVLATNSGDEVYLTDGTVAGTTAVPWPGTAGAASLLGEVDDVFLLARDTALASIDRAGALTTLGDLPAAPQGDPVVLADRLYISTSDGEVLEIDPQSGAATSVFSGALAVTGGARFGRVAFSGDDDTGDGAQPWLYDPASGTAQRLATIQNFQPVSSFPTAFTRFGNETAFATLEFGPTNPAWRIWLSGGTPGTTRVLPTPINARSGGIRLVEVGRQLWILAGFGAAPQPPEIFVTDGTSIQPLTTVGPTASLFDVAAFRDGILLALSSGLYFVDGQGNSTQLRSDIGRFVVTGDRAYYVNEFGPPTELVETDGTVAGTRVLATLSTTGRLRDLAAFDDRIWIAVNFDVVIWDGTSVTSTGVFAQNLIPTPNRLFGVDGFGLVAFERGATTAPLVPISFPEPFTTVGDRLIYRVGGEVFATDGTPTGAELLLDDVTRFDPQAPGLRLEPDRALLFGIFRGSAQERATYVTDGTAAGTTRIENASLNYRSPTNAPLTAVSNGLVYFPRADSTLGTEPYVLDPGALAERVGTSCATASTRTLELTVDRSPVLGSTVTLTGRGAGSTTAALLLGPPAFRTTPFPGSTCPLYVERFGLSAISPIPLDAAGSFRIPLALPSDPVILGIRACFQALFDVPGSVALDASPGLLLQPGR